VSECTDIICSSNSPHEMFITSSDSSTNWQIEAIIGEFSQTAAWIVAITSLCLKLLPTKSTLDKFNSLTEWFDFVSVIVPVAKVVSYESSSMPALQLCQEIVSLQ
jgi:hypothetical protein